MKVFLQRLPTDLYVFALIVLVGGVLYGQTLDVPWYFDDIPAIVNNPTIQNLGLAWRKLLSSRGIVNFSFALNVSLGGLAPAGFHLVNIALHLCTSFFAYLLLKRVFPQNRFLALFAAMIFLVHPLQTQTVNYVVQRMAGMAGLFFFLSMYFYTKGREAVAIAGTFGRKWQWLFFAGALLAGVMALLAKQNTAVLPLAILLYDRFFLSSAKPIAWRRFLRQGLWLLPVAIVIGYFFYRDLLAPLLAGKLMMSIASTEDIYGAGPVAPVYYLFTEFSVLWLYLRLLFLPYGQTLDYGYPVVTTLWAWPTLLALAGLLGLGLLAWSLRRIRPRISFAIGWFFLLLAVESTLIPLDPVFEHRLYLPIFAFAILAADLLAGAGAAWASAKYAVAAVLVLVLCLLSWQRNSLWRDPVLFWADNVKKAPGAYRPVLSLADALFQQGRDAEAVAVYRENLPRLVESPAVFRNTKVLLNIGVAFQRTDDLASADKYLRLAVRSNPRYALAHYNLGVVQYHLDDKAAAVDSFAQAARLAPGNADALYNWAVTALETGDGAPAAKALPILRRLHPNLEEDLRKQMAEIE